LERVELSGLEGAICHYGFGTGACTAEGTMSDVSYAVGVLPEPATAWLLPLELACVAARRHRRARH
jgi:hypothetical protein